MPPPFAFAKSRQTLAIFFAAASEIWLPSYTVVAAFAPTTHSGFDTLVFGAVVLANRGTGAGLAGCATGCVAGGGARWGARGPSAPPLPPKLPPPPRAPRGAEPPMPITPIICLLI